MNYLPNFKEFKPIIIDKDVFKEKIKLYYKKISFLSDDIIYLESDSNYTVFHLKDGKQHISSFTLKYHVEQMQELSQFYRVNRSVFVNLSYIAERTKKHVSLINGKEFLISRRRKKALKLRLKSIENYSQNQSL